VLKFSLVVAAGLILGGCSDFARMYPDDPLLAPKDTRAKFLKDGFNLRVTHTRWQWLTNMDAMFEVCRASIHRTADEIAAEKGVQIEPIDDSKIALDYNRNDTDATSTCIASYPVAYKK
jgi:hypothetical protein